MHSDISRYIEDGGDVFKVEKLLYEKGCEIVAGVDEAGRGPLAGPVLSAAVILPRGGEPVINGITDSKLLSPGRRERIAREIYLTALSVGVGVVQPDQIDKINILEATRLAIQCAVDNLSMQPDLLIIDGKYLGHPRLPVVQLIKGDLYCQSISAASIIAKVERDAIMRRLHEIYPEYGFDRNKGYGTKEHVQAINQYGLSPIHRKSFRIRKWNAKDTG